ncbi:Protein of unknown function [Palleronia marisminoris]|uniref:DUF2783 domain-containing protein n=1 Tax=Palleronia marisminoris TaxID=315423 RepID=UPI0008F3887A|nr:DUF2783 domain-containing protein [Palleronia marisminoris]SFH29862.1 Protein of unknown function [Palleronia marisminoris]
MSALIIKRNIEAPDDAYDLLLSAHQGLSKKESDALNARLILKLFNHVGDIKAIWGAIEVART